MVNVMWRIHQAHQAHLHFQQDTRIHPSTAAIFYNGININNNIFIILKNLCIPSCIIIRNCE